MATKNKCKDPRCKEETELEKCDKCKKGVCLWHIMGDNTEKGGMYCDDCLVIRKKEIEACSHIYDGAILMFGKARQRIVCKKCGLVSANPAFKKI